VGAMTRGDKQAFIYVLACHLFAGSVGGVAFDGFETNKVEAVSSDVDMPAPTSRQRRCEGAQLD